MVRKKNNSVTTYQVSFVKSLDISKDFKRRKAFKFDSKISSLSLGINLNLALKDESYFVNKLLVHDLESSEVLSSFNQAYSDMSKIDIFLNALS